MSDARPLSKAVVIGIGIVSLLAGAAAAKGGGGGSGFIAIFLVGFVLGCLYCVPIFIADARRNPNITAIVWLTILLGWSVLGWVGAFIWALVRSEAAEAIRSAPVYTPAVPAPPPPAPAPIVATAAPLSVADELTKLAALRDSGVLTPEEFEQQKRRALGAAPQAPT